MPIEAEIKARVTDPERLHTALSRRATGERSIYQDRYFDYPDRRWTADGHELRVRTVTVEDGESQVLLTFKEPVLDSDSGSKPEHETSAADAQVLVTVLTALGVQEIIAFRKHCTNYTFSARGRDLTATVVTVPELAGETFIELETTVEPDQFDAALTAVRSVLAELGSSPTTTQPSSTPARWQTDATGPGANPTTAPSTTGPVR